MPPHGPNSQGGRRGGGFSSNRGGGRRGGRGGGGRGGGGAGGGGRGGQRWWDPVWRAERLRQQQAEVMDSLFDSFLHFSSSLVWYTSERLEIDTKIRIGRWTD